MNQAQSSLQFVKDSILDFFSSRQSATQEEILRYVNWPSVLVSSCVGFLIADGVLHSQTKDGRIILSKAARS